MNDALTVRRRDRPGPGNKPRTNHNDLQPLLGVWTNYDEHTTGIVRVEITQRRHAPILRVRWAGDERTDDVGDPDEVVAAAFTAGVSSDEAVGFLAEHEHGGRSVLLAAYLNKRLLVVDAYQRFADATGHSNYFQGDHLYSLPLPNRSLP